MKIKTNFLWFSVDVFKEKEIKLVLKEQFCQSHNNWAIGQNYSRLEGTIRRNRYRVPKVDIRWLF